MKCWYGAVSAVVLGVGVWESALRLGLISPAALAYPTEVLKAVPNILSPWGNLADVGSTIYRAVAAFLLSVPLGVGAGVILFYVSPLQTPGRFLVDFLRSVPATALVPIFLIIYGTGDSTKIAVAAFSSSLVICLATITGLDSRNKTRLLVANLAGLRGSLRVCLVDIPEAAPQLFLGLRTGISLSLILVVVSEMLIGSNRGLGRVIADMQYTDDKGRMYAAILATGAIGYALNVALKRFERLELWWSLQR